MLQRLYELKNLLTQLEAQGGYFINFLDTKGIQAGIMRLRADENDIQEPHSVDEVYFIIEGSGFIKLGDNDYEIRQGISIFVPAGVKHKFYGNKQDLIIFYALGC